MGAYLSWQFHGNNKDNEVFLIKQTFLGSLRAFEMVKKRSRRTVIYAKSDWHFNLYRLPFLSYSPCIPPKWPKADLSKLLFWMVVTNGLARREETYWETRNIYFKITLLVARKRMSTYFHPFQSFCWQTNRFRQLTKPLSTWWGWSSGELITSTLSHKFIVFLCRGLWLLQKGQIRTERLTFSLSGMDIN